jgi:hypothetical protein
MEIVHTDLKKLHDIITPSQNYNDNTSTSEAT